MKGMTTKRVLVCPLDWGLGHATRCIPIIRELLKLKVEVIIGSDGPQSELLKEEFPKLAHMKLPGYNASYPKKGGMIFSMLKQTPGFLKMIKKEHLWLDQIIDKHKIDGVISDNRYGLWSNRIPCVFITHQLMIKSGLFSSLSEKVIRKKYTSRFTYCWVPDIEDEPNLSGDLSHRYPASSNQRFIGPLSRFRFDFSKKRKPRFDVMILLSGPEPQRSYLESILTSQIDDSNLKFLIVAGTPGNNTHYKEKNIEYISHMPGFKLQEAILDSSEIICRPGYSTIMDLAVIGKRAIVIPTPGQTEQEYLGAFHMSKGHHYCINQDEFNLEQGLLEITKYKGVQISKNDTGESLTNRVKEFIKSFN